MKKKLCLVRAVIPAMVFVFWVGVAYSSPGLVLGQAAQDSRVNKIAQDKLLRVLYEAAFSEVRPGAAIDGRILNAVIAQILTDPAADYKADTSALKTWLKEQEKATDAEVYKTAEEVYAAFLKQPCAIANVQYAPWVPDPPAVGDPNIDTLAGVLKEKAGFAYLQTMAIYSLKNPLPANGVYTDQQLDKDKNLLSKIAKSVVAKGGETELLTEAEFNAVMSEIGVTGKTYDGFKEQAGIVKTAWVLAVARPQFGTLASKVASFEAKYGDPASAADAAKTIEHVMGIEHDVAGELLTMREDARRKCQLQTSPDAGVQPKGEPKLQGAFWITLLFLILVLLAAGMAILVFR